MGLAGRLGSLSGCSSLGAANGATCGHQHGHQCRFMFSPHMCAPEATTSGGHGLITADVKVVLALALPVEGSPPCVREGKPSLRVGTVVHSDFSLGLDWNTVFVHQRIGRMAALVTRVRGVGETASELPRTGPISVEALLARST